MYALALTSSNSISITVVQLSLCLCPTPHEVPRFSFFFFMSLVFFARSTRQCAMLIWLYFLPYRFKPGFASHHTRYTTQGMRLDSIPIDNAKIVHAAAPHSVHVEAVQPENSTRIITAHFCRQQYKERRNMDCSTEGFVRSQH